MVGIPSRQILFLVDNLIKIRGAPLPCASFSVMLTGSELPREESPIKAKQGLAAVEASAISLDSCVALAAERFSRCPHGQI